MRKEALQHNPFFDKPMEECGVSAVVSKIGEPVTHLLASIEDLQQHRGYDSAGIAAYDKDTGVIVVHKGPNEVKDVFPEDFDYKALNLLSHVGIGQNRYGTSEKNGDKDDLTGAQPMMAEYEGRRVAISYNGNLPDATREKLRSNIPQDILKEHSFDTQDIADAIASGKGEDWVDKIRNGLNGIDGAYSLTILTDDGRLFGLRGPSGTWPLWKGETQDKIILASETRVDQALPEEDVMWKEVNPGELIEVTNGKVKSRQIFTPTTEAVCSLHAMYGARPDSLMHKNGEPVTYGEFRKRVGRVLAQEHPVDADLVLGIPETGKMIAEGYGEELGIKVDHAMSVKKKNKKALEDSDSKMPERSYLAKTPEEAAAVVNGKFEILHPSLLEGKKVVAVDDSLIKGVTAGGDPEKGMTGTVQLLRKAGATEVHFMTGMPLFVEGCDMGYVIKKDRLIAVTKGEDGVYTQRTNEEIAAIIGADSFSFVSTEGLKNAFESTLHRKDVACFGCVGGGHPLEPSVPAQLTEMSAVN